MSWKVYEDAKEWASSPENKLLSQFEIQMVPKFKMLYRDIDKTLGLMLQIDDPALAPLITNLARASGYLQAMDTDQLPKVQAYIKEQHRQSNPRKKEKKK